MQLIRVLVLSCLQYIIFFQDQSCAPGQQVGCGCLVSFRDPAFSRAGLARRSREDSCSRRDMAATSAEISRLVTVAFAPATEAAYMQGIQSFDQCRSVHGLALNWPAPTPQVIHFVAHLSLLNRAPSTARAYLAGIAAKHKLNNWPDPTVSF